MSFLELFFPKLCLNCGKLGNYFCPNCQKKLKPLTKDYCFYCQKPSLYGLTHFGCQKKLGLDGKMSIFYYNPVLKKILKNIKYRLVKEVWNDFSKSIKPEYLYKLDFYKKTGNNYFFQPIPITKNKLKLRGFNQAYLIANFFQKFLNFPIIDILEKIKETKPQAEIKNYQTRKSNIKNAFQIKNNSLTLNSKIILIDDLVTTGATTNEVCRTLKKAGFKKVYLLTLAQG